MEVAFVSTGYHPIHSGGGSISSRLIVEELERRGISVDVYTTTGADKGCSELDTDIYEIPDGTAARLPRRVGKNYGVYDTFRARSQYDLLHVYGLGSLPGAVAAADIPVLGTINNLEWTCVNWTEYLRQGCPDHGFRETVSLAYADGYRTSLPLKVGMETAGKLLAKRADHFTVQNEGMADVLSRCGYPERSITPVPNLLDPQFERQSTAETNRLVYVGRLVEKKGARDIVEAFIELDSQLRSDWTFSIYGAGQQKDAIADRIARTDADIEIDYVPYDELPSVYADASVLVHGSKYPEPFSRTWLEAMASGTAIICSENPSSRAVLDGIAALYDPFDSESLRAVLEQVLSDPDRRAEMIAAGLDTIPQYRPERVVAQYETLYRELIG